MADSGAAVGIELQTASSSVQYYARDGELTRPSVRLGRQLSVKRKRQVTVAPAADGSGGEHFQRDAVVYRSLPHVKGERTAEGSARMRRASSLTGVDNRYEQWEDLTVNFGDIRQSSRRLEDRIAQQ